LAASPFENLRPTFLTCLAIKRSFNEEGNYVMKIIVFSSESYVSDSFNAVNQQYGYQLTFHKTTLSMDNVALTKGYDVVCLFVNDRVDLAMMQALKENGCKLIALRCAGFNNIDIDAAKRCAMPVVRVPDYSPYAVAEHAFALLLTLNRKTHKAYNRIRDSNFNIDGLVGFDLNQKIMGVIGTGKIGLVFIKIALGFGMKVQAYDLYPNVEKAQEMGFEYVTLEKLIAESDVLSLHCPLTPDNHHLINANALTAMKKGVVILNTSRGGLVDSAALIEALKQGQVGAVALDVYEEEEKYFFHDLSANSGIDDDVLARLLTFNHVLITSHQAFLTQEALHNIAETTFENIALYFKHHQLKHSIY
jgi:D-lactate dehydrogenase